MTDWTTIRERARADIHAAGGREVTHHPLSGPDQSVTAVFFDEHTTYEETGRGGVSTTQPKLEVQRSALDTPPQIDDEWTVGNTRYVAVDVLPDGRGEDDIMLRKA